MRVVQVSLVRPRGRPDPEALLAAWPTLGDVAEATAGAGVETIVVQSFHRDAELERGGVLYRFVAEAALPDRPTGLQPWRLAKAARAAAPDVIHVNGLDFAWHTRVLCALGRPVLAQDHASAAARLPLLASWGLAKVRGLAFTDTEQARSILARAGLPADLPVFAVPESSTWFTAGDRNSARTIVGVYGDPAVLWVGRLQAKKDPLTMLDAVERAAVHLPRLRVWCCFHEAPLLEAVQARIAASPALSSCVRLLGRRPRREVELLCRAADIFLSTSRFEGSGYALIEAIACGAAPVVSDIPSFRALTGGGAIGALAPAGDAEAFSRALVSVARQPREPLRQGVIEHFRQTLSFERVGRRLSEIYTELAQARR